MYTPERFLTALEDRIAETRPGLFSDFNAYLHDIAFRDHRRAVVATVGVYGVGQSSRSAWPDATSAVLLRTKLATDALTDESLGITASSLVEQIEGYLKDPGRGQFKSVGGDPDDTQAAQGFPAKEG